MASAASTERDTYWYVLLVLINNDNDAYIITGVAVFIYVDRAGMLFVDRSSQKANEYVPSSSVSCT